MITLPFILKVEGTASKKVSPDSIPNELTMVPSDLELAITFLEIEARCRNLGVGWKHIYLTKALIPHALIQPEPEYTIMIEAFTGSKPIEFQAQKAANIAKIGTLLKAKSDEEFVPALKATNTILDVKETDQVKLRGLVDQKSVNRLLPFFTRQIDVGPSSKLTNFVPFLALDSEVDNARAIEIAQKFHGLMESLDTALEKHYQVNQFYHESTDEHLSSLETTISEIKDRLEKNLSSRGERVEKQTKSFQSLQQDKLFEAEGEFAEKSKNVVREFIPLLTKLQNQVITIHNDLQLKKSQLNERNFDPKRLLTEIKAMDTQLVTLLAEIQDSHKAFKPKVQDILVKLKKIEKETTTDQKKINLEYQTNLKKQDAETQQLIKDSEVERKDLEQVYKRIDKEYQGVVEKITKIREHIQNQKDEAFGYTLDPGQFPVSQTTDLLYIPVYIAKLEKQNQAQYIVHSPGIWNPQAMDPGARLTVPQLILKHTTEPIRVRLEKIINSSEALSRELDRVGLQYNLPSDVEAETLLASGYSQLITLGVIHEPLAETLKKSWIKALRYCSHCGTGISTRKGFCNECGKPILHKIGETF
jgi:hypothetical protein